MDNSTEAVMMNLNIQVAENGFVVKDEYEKHLVSRMWAFETAESLAEFIKKWGNDVKNPPNKTATDK